MTEAVSRETLVSRQRQQRYRDRLSKASMFACFDIPYSLAASLIESGFLTEADSFDPRKRGEALIRYVVAQRKPPQK
jgi:hypothetical protein